MRQKHGRRWNQPINWLSFDTTKYNEHLYWSIFPANAKHNWSIIFHGNDHWILCLENLFAANFSYCICFEDKLQLIEKSSFVDWQIHLSAAISNGFHLSGFTYGPCTCLFAMQILWIFQRTLNDINIRIKAFLFKNFLATSSFPNELCDFTWTLCQSSFFLNNECLSIHLQLETQSIFFSFPLY